jgi:outer membrane protein OmpA-like peptidoglycan-associated protein
MGAPLRLTVVVSMLALLCATTARAGNDTVTGHGIKLQVDKAKVDLKQHRLEVKMWPRSGKISLAVVGQSGATLAEEEQDFADRPAGAPLILTWTPSSDEEVAKITIRAGDERGYIGVELTPWSVMIPHDDVIFRTDSSDIDAAEVPKLEAAFARLGDILAKDKEKKYRSITLFIAGHTDTVGDSGYNLKLSRERARAIAAWFRHRGARVALAFEGFGETALAVSTADGVDEPRNRRVDYILSNDEPVMKTTGYRPAWKRLK